MESTIHQDEKGAEIRLVGRLTFDDHQKFKDFGTVFEGKGPLRVVLDLSRLEFIDSAGLGMFVVLKDMASRANTPIFYKGANGVVAKLMALVHFDSVIGRLE